MRISQLIAFVFLYLLSLTATGQTCCTGGIPILDAFSPPSTSSKEIGIHAFFNYNSNKDLVFDDSDLSDSHISREISAYVIQIDYGISDAFSLSLSMPYLSQTEQVETINGTSEYNNNGLGDLSAWLTYSKSFSRWSLSTSVSLKMPTGKTNETGEDQITLPLSLQLGSGSWDVAGIIRSSFYLDKQNKFSIENQASFRFNSKGQKFDAHPNYRFGHQIHTFLGGAYHFLLSNLVTDLYSGISYQFRMMDRFEGGFENNNTGGHWLNLNVGTNMYFTPQIFINLAMGMPIYRQLNGLQLTTTWQGNMAIHFVL